MDNLTGLDMIVAITQQTINSELWNLFTTPLDPNDPNSDYVISHTLETHPKVLPPNVPAPGPGITAVVGSMDEGLAPTVELNFPTTNRHNLVFKVPLTSGTMNYFDILTGQLATIRIDHWTIAFDVNMNIVEITAKSLPSSGASAAAQRYLQQFSDQEFTINRLALDFENANLANMDVKGSTVPGDPNSIAHITIIATLSGYFQGLKDSSNPYILGYPISSKNPQQTHPVLPAIEPTTTTFSTTPYIVPPPRQHWAIPAGAAANTPGQDDLSTLNFLMMTQHKSFPTDPNTGLFNLNWVNSSDMQGVMVVANRIFTSAYLEQLLIPTICAALFSSLGLPSVEPTKTATGWNIQHEEKQNKVVVGSDSGIENIYADFTARSNCDLQFLPGSKQMVGTGYFYRYAYYYETPFVQPSGIWVANLTVQLNWTLAINLSAGDGLIVVTHSISQNGDISEDFNENPVQKLGDLLGGNIASIKDAVGNQYKQLENIAFDRLTANLSAGLNHLQNRTVLPGGKVFFFKDLTFNAEQDMLVTLTYKD